MAPARITNSEIIQYPIASRTTGIDATYIGFWTALRGGEFLGSGLIKNNPDVIADGQRYNLPVDAINIDIPNGAYTTAMAEKIADGMILGGMYISLHNGNPGATGANEISVSWYARAWVAPSKWQVTIS